MGAALGPARRAEGGLEKWGGNGKTYLQRPENCPAHRPSPAPPPRPACLPRLPTHLLASPCSPPPPASHPLQAACTYAKRSLKPQDKHLLGKNQNAYLVAKIVVDTAENELPKVTRKRGSNIAKTRVIRPPCFELQIRFRMSISLCRKNL